MQFWQSILKSSLSLTMVWVCFCSCASVCKQTYYLSNEYVFYNTEKLVLMCVRVINNYSLKEIYLINCLDQWFSTGVPRNLRVPQKAVGVPAISKFDWYLLVNCSLGCRQNVIKPRKGSANQKRLRTTDLSKWSSRFLSGYNY